MASGSNVGKILPSAGKWTAATLSSYDTDVVPEPSLRLDLQKFWENQLIFPYSVDNLVHAFGGPKPSDKSRNSKPSYELTPFDFAPSHACTREFFTWWSRHYEGRLVDKTALLTAISNGFDSSILNKIKSKLNARGTLLVLLLLASFLPCVLFSYAHLFDAGSKSKAGSSDSSKPLPPPSKVELQIASRKRPHSTETPSVSKKQKPVPATCSSAPDKDIPVLSTIPEQTTVVTTQDLFPSAEPTTDEKKKKKKKKKERQHTQESTPERKSSEIEAQPDTLASPEDPPLEQSERKKKKKKKQKKSPAATTVIWEYEDSDYFYFVIFVDTFMMLLAEENEALVMKNILSTYEIASGQSINLLKSEVYFSRNVLSPIKNSIANLLGVEQVLGTGKYLGLPSMVGRSKKATFKFIKDRIWKKINSWSSRCLSQAGREVMIKSVLQSISSYIMSIFLIPHSLSDEIEKMMNSFWWGHNQEQAKGIHCLSWERLAMHKNVGGLGFKSITAFNYAMLGKQTWNLLTNPGSLITRIFKAKYFSRSDFLSSSIGHNPSYVWRSIWSAKFVVRNGYQWVVGSGHDIPIWNHRWISDGSIIPTPPNLHEELANMTISDIFIGNEKRWNAHLIQDLVDDNTATKILKTHLLASVQNDRIIWRYEKNDIYSVKSAYRYCVVDAIDTSHLQVPGHWNLIWTIKSPPKLRNFLWRLCRNCVPTRVHLNAKGVNCPNSCVLCDDGLKDSHHVFFFCKNSESLWRNVGWWNMIQQHINNNAEITGTIFSVLQVLGTAERSLFAALLWSIWQQRNNKIWKNHSETLHVVCDRARNLIMEWNVAQEQ
ncbi:unnamed protein product [Trifolium pratense]|uniref:Uncharacterized protein n=1 Tax=Trifolium pratense TaxID=57577 RepID=A0ACB0IXI7_TRIPR|nr:unnamed protein product [Trifolium pratense]